MSFYGNAQNAWLTHAAPEAFAFAVREIQADPSNTARKTSAGRLTAQAYVWEQITRQYQRLYRELHAITQDARRPPSMAAHTWSTPGDSRGREIAARG